VSGKPDTTTLRSLPIVDTFWLRLSMKSSSHSTFLLEDGASLAYEVLGARKEALPIILVGGLSSTRQDWQRLAVPLAASRPGEHEFAIP